MHRRLVMLSLAVSACAAFPIAARADAPYAFDTAPGKLPKTVVPIDYDISLRPDLSTLTFTGDESVRIRVRTATSTIVVNTHDMTVSRALLDGHPVAAIATDNDKQVTTFSTGAPVSPGEHRLAIAFAGKIGDQPSGLFYQKYRSADGQHTMLATQMESTDARRVFPSWDEPSFRATYRLSVTVPKAFDAVSNMPATAEQVAGETKTVTFARTPKMASYLVVLCAGEFGYLKGEADGVAVRVVAPKGREQNGQYALESAEKLLSYYDDYFGVKFPLPKLDLIAVPGGFPGAMENWGGITFTSDVLLFDPSIQPESAKNEIFQTIAHEMSHQWFGDLVTMAWWDGLWLNEGFADWMQTKATDHFNPSWHLWDRVNGDVERAMQTDGQNTTHPVQTPIADETQADSAFDEITYQKGGAFVRMMEEYLGEDTFRDGIRQYMRANAYGNTTSANLYAALSNASKQDVAAFATAWTTAPGFPLVTVDERCVDGKTAVAVKAQRFFYEANQTSEQQWRIPLSIGDALHASDAHTVLLSAASGTFDGGPCGDPVLVNAGAAGYFRVQYDSLTAATLTHDLARLAPADQVRILADTRAAVQSGAVAPSAALDEIAQLRGSQSLAVWDAALNTLRGIAQDERGQPGERAFDAYERAVLRPVFDRIGWAGDASDATTPALRRALLEALGSAGDTRIVADARARFERFQADPSSLPPDLRETVLGIVASYADEPTWMKLHALLGTSKSLDEAQVYARALWHARAPELASKNLAMATNGEIPPEAGPIAAIIDVAIVAQEGHQPGLAWSFYKANEPKLVEHLSDFERSFLVAKFLPAFWQGASRADLEAFAKSHTSAESVPQVTQAMHQIDLRVATAQRVVPSVDRWVAAHPSGATAQGS